MSMTLLFMLLQHFHKILAAKQRKEFSKIKQSFEVPHIQLKGSKVFWRRKSGPLTFKIFINAFSFLQLKVDCSLQDARNELTRILHAWRRRAAIFKMTLKALRHIKWDFNVSFPHVRASKMKRLIVKKSTYCRVLHCTLSRVNLPATEKRIKISRAIVG